MKKHLSIIGHTNKKEQGLEAMKQTFLKSDKSVKIFSALLGFFVLLLVSVALSQLGKLSTEYSIEQFFPARHPLLAQSAKIRRTFQLQERPAFLIVLERSKETWLNPAPLRELSSLTHRIQEMKETSSAFSLATLEGALNEKDSLNIGPLYERLPVSQWKSYTESNELIRSQLISRDARSVLLVVEPRQLSPKALANFSDRLSREIHHRFPQVRVEIGGVPAIQAQLSAKLLGELKLFLMLSLLAFCSVFFLFFRGLSPVLLTLASLLLANAAVLGGMAACHIPFSILLTTLPIVVSIALVSVNIHSLHRWAELVSPQMRLPERWSLAMRVLREMALANFLGSLTTSIGFITLCGTEIPLIRQYGWVVATCVMAAWLLTHLILMGFMLYTTPRLRAWTQRKALWSLPLLRQARPIFISILLGGLAMVFIGKDVSFSGRLFDDLPRHASARRATEKIDHQFGGVAAYDLQLRARSADFWKDPAHLAKLRDLLQVMRRQKSVGSALSLTDFFESGKIPATREAVAELMFLYSMSENNPLKNYVTDNGQTLRISIRFHDLPSHSVAMARAQLKKITRADFPGVSLREAGLAVSSHLINQEVARGLVFNFWHSILLVGLLLLFVFRSWRWALVACLPNLLPPAILIGALALTQTPVKPGVALIFSIALGLAFNNTVYLLSRMKRMMAEKNLSILPLRQALMQEGNPCLLETLVMFAGFVIFLASDFKLNQIFGVYMLLSIISGAVGDLVFLPALLKIFPSLLLGRRPAPTPLPLPALPAPLTEDNEESFEIFEASGVGKIAASLLLCFLIFSLTPSRALAAGANEATAFLHKVQKQVEAKDDQALVKMKIIESNGEVKNRSLRLQTLRDDKFYALARILAPADIKGTAFLAQIKGEKEDQWIYLPSTKQVRRVVGTKKSSGVLGSELTVEDLNSTAIKSSSVKLIKKTPQMEVLEVIPKPGTSLYNKVLMSFDAKNLVPLQTQYFQKGRMKKTVRFSKYTKVGSVWRAQLIQVKNLANKRGTDLELSDIKVNSGLTDEDFSVGALKPD